MTASGSLKSLTIAAFRGSSETFTLEFTKGAKLTLIYGENGTGKTTICDALDFLAFGNVGSLEECGIGSNLERFWPTVGKQPKDLFVELKMSSGECSGSMIGKKPVVKPSTPKLKIELLRRRQVLKLIEAQPAKRYDEIKRFIDIEPFEKSEDGLRKLCKVLSSEYVQAQQAEAENLETLQGFFVAAEEPAGMNPVSWANERLGALSGDLDIQILAIDNLRSAFVAMASLSTRLVTVLETTNAATIALRSAEKALAAAVSTAGKDASDLLALLESAQKFLSAQPHMVDCPLCGSNERVADLAGRVNERLSVLDALKKATFQRNKQAADLSAAHNAEQQIKADYQKSVATFLAAKSSRDLPPGIALPVANPPAEMGTLKEWLAAAEAAAKSWSAMEASLRGEEKFVAALRSTLEQYNANLVRRTDLQELIPRLERALEICVAERQAFTDSIIKDIAKNVRDLYEQVHPGEGLSAIDLPLDPAKRASLELRAAFGEQSYPPQAYFSQSHLDTLGLCVFLALALRDHPGDKILVLDDVLGSADEPHVERVIQMIYGVSKQFRHTIVTTHYRPWREKYRWGWLKSDQPCQFVELSLWNLDGGIRAIDSLPELERLKSLLLSKPIDAQAICGKAGVPRRKGGAYTLGDLLPAVGEKLRKALFIETRDNVGGASHVTRVELKPILDELQRIAQTRNVLGAHFNAISFDLLDADALTFASLVVKLMDALTHPIGGWPNSDKSGSYWQNGGDTRRLHPLTKPN
jgi:energy-coupling factor transporter ATP-binding protein EcfA2